ncbi:MAG TPA: DUF3465 domain-containing protein [Thermoanaerobaculia bacterium]
MRKVLLSLLAVAALVGAIVYLGRATQRTSPTPGGPAPVPPGTWSVERAFEGRRSGVPVEGRGTVVRILPDDEAGSRHQRFIVRLDAGGTVLLAHAIDVAGRVSPLRVGDELSFRGEYVWNPKGGLVHWTHRDPVGRHAAGWIRRGDRIFE